MDKDIDEIVARRLNARGISCGYRSESLDKSGLVRFHYAAEKEFKKFVDETGCSATNPFFCRLVDQSNPIVSPLNTLEKIKFRDIDLTEFRRKVANRVFVRRLTGRVICGRLCVKPFKTAGVHTVLEEEGESGAAVLVLIDNAVTSTASDADIQAKFPEGMKVAIKEPVLRELWEDGTVGVNITNPADIVPLGDSASAVPGSMLSAEFLQQEGVLGSSEAIRIRGNAHFAQKNWKKAAEAYKLSAGFLEAYEQKTHSVPTVDPVILQEKLTIAYSNRCEALLRIGSYKQALNDVRVALKLNPTHEKSLLRMARSLQGMQRYEEAVTCLEVLRALKSRVTPDRHIWATIRDSEVTSRQTHSGIYHFDDFIEVFEEQKEAPACAQFVGPIEIRVGSEHGRRGMFATRDVVPGELLLVSKATATTKEAEVRTGPRVYYTWGKFVSQPGSQAYPAAIDAPKQDVVVKVIARAQESPQVAAQIDSLQGGEARHTSCDSVH